MSRINQDPVDDSDLVSAADLNAKYNDFSQAGALNAFNLRDAAVDLPQLDNNGFMLKHMQTDVLGKLDFNHAAPVVVASTAVLPPVPNPIQDGAGGQTIANFGIGGLTVTTADILRVYWDLSVNPTYNATPWVGSPAAALSLVDNPATPLLVANQTSCWVLWLQWDITSNALANFQPVTNQDDFGNILTGSIRGNALSSCMASAVVPAWIQRDDLTSRGIMQGNQVDHRVGWRGVSGAYYLQPANPVTIYGIRVVAAGLMAAYNAGGVNYLQMDTLSAGVGQTLEYTGGSLTTVVHTLG